MFKYLKTIFIVALISLLPATAYAGFPYSMTFTVSAGDTILADHYNTGNNEHINNNIPESIDDYSITVAEMGSVTDPFPAGTESQATTLDGELQRLRNQIFDLVSLTSNGGTATKWYHDVGSAIGSHDHADASSGGALGTDTIISDFTAATHDHANNAGGGILSLYSITLGTEQASTSGTSIDFTSIPAGTKRITVMFKGVSTNGTDDWLIRLGDSGGAEASGYFGSGTQIAAGVNTTKSTIGFLIETADQGVNTILNGSVTLTLENSANFTWTAQGMFGSSDNHGLSILAGRKALSAELDRVRITTTGGSNTFDAGAINIQYEQ